MTRGARLTRLTQMKQIQAIEAAAGAWSGEGREDPSREIEESRREWEDRQRRTEPASRD
jgi:hypothetical protein